MKQAVADFVGGCRLAWNGWSRLSRLLAQRYWPWVVGTMATFGLIIAGAVWQHQQNFGTIPWPALEITGEAWWEYGGPDPELVVRARRIRNVDCAGGNLARHFLYSDGREIPARATRASSPSPDALSPTPVVTGRDKTPDDNVFWLRFVMKRPDTHGLTQIRWVLNAPAAFCEDGQQRIGQGVGLIPVPKPAEYFASAGSPRPPNGGPSN